MSAMRRGGPGVKTVTFACVHFTVAFTIAYLLTGSIGVSSLIALVEPIANTVAFYLHERLWERADVARAARAHAIPATGWQGVR